MSKWTHVARRGICAIGGMERNTNKDARKPSTPKKPERAPSAPSRKAQQRPDPEPKAPEPDRGVAPGITG